VAVNLVSFWFGLKGNKKPLSQISIAPTLSQDFLDINFIIREEAGSDLPIRGQSKAIAVCAEMAAYRANQPDFSKGPFKSKPFRWTIPSIHWNRNQVSHPFKMGFYLRDGEEFTFLPLLSVTRWHILYITDGEGKAESQPSKGFNLIVI
jgi:hypothetical protein